MTQKTTAIFGIAVMAAILLGGLTFSQSALANGGGGQNKVTLCHVDQETGEEITITVGAPAVPAHLAHGDTLGECVDEPSTCDECLDAVETAADECEDTACEKSVLQAFAECTLTCEGEGAGAPEFCWNSEAGSLASCLIPAETDEDVNACGVNYITAVFSCAFNP